MAYWPSHAGKLVPLEAMAEPHLVAAMAKLRAQETLLVRIIAGVDKDAAKAFRKEMAAWTPVILPGEMLQRTRDWIAALGQEQYRRMLERFPELI